MDDKDFPDLSELIGKRVRLQDGSGDPDDVEYGVIVHAWIDQELEAIDCHIAFFGSSQPNVGEKPTERPYVLRYFLSSLEEY